MSPPDLDSPILGAGNHLVALPVVCNTSDWFGMRRQHAVQGGFHQVVHVNLSVFRPGNNVCVRVAQRGCQPVLAVLVSLVTFG